LRHAVYAFRHDLNRTLIYGVYESNHDDEDNMGTLTVNDLLLSGGNLQGGRAGSGIATFTWLNLPAAIGLTYGFSVGDSGGFTSHYVAHLAGEITHAALTMSSDVGTATFGAFEVVLYVNGALQDTSATYSTPGDFTISGSFSHYYLTAGPGAVSVSFAAGDVINVGINVSTALSVSTMEPCVTLLLRYDT
jgi:hypothetical protein